MDTTIIENHATADGENTFKINEKIEIATQTLERNIVFVSNCDNKTSIVLTAVGVLLTIILTNEGANEIIRIMQQCISNPTFCDVFFMFCSLLSFAVLLFGIYDLVRVLVAKVSESAHGLTENPSRIFFAGIHSNGAFCDYFNKFNTMTKDELLEELLTQVYINSDIAVRKYSLYNKGLKCTTIGFVLCVTMFLIGSYIY